MSNHPVNSYSNPAFCQQSEFYNQRCKSPNIRQSPVGAQTPNHQRYEEQEFYEEMIVDDSGTIQEKKFVVVHNENKNFERGRYEYIPMQEQQENRVRYHEEIDASTGRIHRYAIIHPEDISPPPLPPKNPNRYALVPLEEIPNPNKARYAVITQEEVKSPGRYEYIPDSYEDRGTPPKPRGNPAATKKLHELLTTPRKQISSPPTTPQQMKIKPTPRAQQKLNYSIATRNNENKQHAIVAPMVCSSPAHSIYSETTFMSMKKPQVQATLAVAAFMLILCGGLTSGLCFYMISFMKRSYFLDFGMISGFTCLLFGLMGYRSRNVRWLPNRNYISGYVILSIFSLLTCAGLLVLLFMQPKPGTPLADMTSGAVCGISGLSLLLASSGVVASYCCKEPPPDNRVQHCAPGFTV